MRLRAILCLAASTLALAGCNQLISAEPWFQPDPAAPALRDGIWREVEVDCAFDDSRPVARWPDCADGFIVKDGKPAGEPPVGTEKKGEVAAGWTDGSLVVSPGDPMIWRAEMLDKSDDGKPARFFIYAAVQIDARDSTGKVTQMTRWPVICGPLVAGKYPETAGENVTSRPWPGLTVADGSCTAASASAVREAARLSYREAVLKENLGHIKWVRDGLR